MAVRLDAVGDGLSRTANLGSHSTGFVIMMWAYLPASSASDYYLITVPNADDSDKLVIAHQSGQLRLYSDLGPAAVVAGSVSVAKWFHVCLRVTSLTSSRMYLNGKQVGSSYNPSPSDVGSYQLGHYNASAFWDGRIAHVKAWNAVLNDAQIFDEAAITYPRNALASLNFYWPLDSATDTADYGPNGRNPTISGTLTTEASPPFTILTLTPATLQARLSTKSGSAGNSLASTPAGSLGKYISSTPVRGGVGNLFRAVTPAEAETGAVTYRCLFFANTHATITLIGVKVWIGSQTPNGSDVSIGLDPAGVSALDASTAQAADIANETTAPAGVTFSLNTHPQYALLLPQPLGPGQCFALWVRRSVRPGAMAMAADTITLNVDGVEV